MQSHDLLFDELSIVETMSANLSVLFYSIFTYHKKFKTHCYSALAIHVVYLTFLHSTRSLVFQYIPDICHGRHGRRPCKFFLAGVNFYRFNAKNWQFTV